MSEKHLNVRLAVGILVSLLAAAAAVHVAHGFQVRRHARTLMEQADRAEEAGQNERAVVLLKRYLELAPDDTPALLHYAESLEKLPATPEDRWLAAAAYRQVLSRSPNRRDVRERLVGLLMDLEEYADARDQLEILLHAAPALSLPGPGSAGLEALLARCREEEGDPEAALSAYAQAVEHDPAQVECYSRQAALLFNHFGRSDDADAVMDRLVQVNETNFAAHLDRCLYRMGRGRLDDAAKDLAAAQALAPTDGRVMVTAAELAYRRGRTDEARAAWVEGLKQHPEALTMYRGLATLELSDKRPKEAATCLARGLEKYPNNIDLLHLLTETYLAQNDVVAAEEVAARVRRMALSLSGPDSDALGVAAYLHARVLAHQGRAGEAIPLLEKALAPQDLPNALAVRMHVCLAQCYERTGDAAAALKAYTSAFDRGERRPDVVYRLLQLLAAQGRHADADAVLSRAQEQLLPRGELARLGAEAALRARRPERAVMLARLAVPAESRDFRHFIWLGNVLATADRRTEAEAALRHAVEIRDNVPDTWVALIGFLAHGDREREADDALRTMRDKLNPAQLPLALALCEEALGRLDAAEKHYLEARALLPSDGPALQRLAAFYVRLDQTKKAEPALRDLLDPTLRFPPGTSVENVAWARRQLAMLRAEAGDEAGYAEAQALLAANGGPALGLPGPGPADVRAAAFVRATRDAERSEALRALEETLTAQPLAPDEQFRLAKRYDAAGRWADTREQLTAALEVDRRNPEYLAYFVAGLLKRGRHSEARAWLTRLEAVEPDSARVKAFQARVKAPR